MNFDSGSDGVGDEADLVRRLRRELDSLLAVKLEQPGLELADSPLAAACMELLSTDGF